MIFYKSFNHSEIISKLILQSLWAVLNYRKSTQKIKERDDVVLTHVSKKNRDRLADSLFLEAQGLLIFLDLIT